MRWKKTETAVKNATITLLVLWLRFIFCTLIWVISRKFWLGSSSCAYFLTGEIIYTQKNDIVQNVVIHLAHFFAHNLYFTDTHIRWVCAVKGINMWFLLFYNFFLIFIRNVSPSIRTFSCVILLPDVILNMDLVKL